MPPLPWPDDVLVRLGLSVALAWTIVLAFTAALWPRSEPRLPSLIVAVFGLAVSPFVIPTGYPGARALSVFVCCDAIFRVIDANRRAAVRRGFGETVRFFVPFPVLLVTGEEWEASQPARSPIGPAIIRAVTGLALIHAAWAILVFSLPKVEILHSSYVIDHVVKTTLFAFTLEIIGLLANGLERLAGFDAPPLMRRILFSRTPAEFWWRYNTRVQTWLVRNVFRRVGGVRHPGWGVVLVFFVSAIFHEAAFDIALSRIDGYQFTFFMLQIPAVLASPSLERFARRGRLPAAISHVATITWFGVTSVFFFRGIGEIFPYYYTAPMPEPVFGEWRF